MSATVAKDPNATLEQLSSVVVEHPRKVLGNPALPVLLLGDPEKGANVVSTGHCLLAKRALERELRRATYRKKVLLAHASGRRMAELIVGPYWRLREPAEQALQALRLWAVGEMPDRDIRSFWRLANEVWAATIRVDRRDPVQTAAWGIWRAVQSGLVNDPDLGSLAEQGASSAIEVAPQVAARARGLEPISPEGRMEWARVVRWQARKLADIRRAADRAAVQG